MNNLWAFGEMTDSSSLLADPDALRARYDEDGYLLLRGLLDVDAVLEVRREVTSILKDVGWLLPNWDPLRALTDAQPVREGDEEYFRAHDPIQRLESFHTLAHDPALVAAMRTIVGDTAFPHPLKVVRLVFPDHHEATTPPHQDFLNNQGTPALTAAWIPLGDCPRQLGSLAVLRGSHRHGIFPLAFHLGPGNRQADLPADVLETHRWVTTDFVAGDVLVFGALTVHASLHNARHREMRLSVDYRYQPEGEPLTALVLRPHFGRLTWDEIYRGWRSDEHQWYWRDLDVEVVDFDRSDFEIGDPTHDQVAEVLLYRQRMEALAAARDRSGEIEGST